MQFLKRYQVGLQHILTFVWLYCNIINNREFLLKPFTTIVKYWYGVIHLVRIRKISQNTKISYPLMRTRIYAYMGVRNFSFLENFAYALSKWFLLSYCKSQAVVCMFSTKLLLLKISQNSIPACNFIIRWFWHKRFPVSFTKFWRTSFPYSKHLSATAFKNVFEQITVPYQNFIGLILISYTAIKENVAIVFT